MRVAFSPPDISELEIMSVVDVLKSGWITTGVKTKEFERRIAEYCGTSRAACMNSQTAAAEMTLRLLGIGAGDEVITSAYTYTASASVIHHIGARIVLCDTAKDSFEMDCSKLGSLITEKTKAIILVDYAGVVCDYHRIFEIVNKKRALFHPNNKLQEAFGRVIVLADAAHSFGATRDGKPSGQFADFSCFSFHAVKNLTTAEGGAVTWRDIPGFDHEEIYRAYMLLCLHGQSKDALAKDRLGAWEYDIEGLYHKCNMTDIQAALGLAQLERYPAIVQKRRDMVALYNSLLHKAPLDVFLHEGDHFSGNGHLYPVRLRGMGEAQRNALIHALAEAGVSANVHYKPLPLFTAYKALGFDIQDFPNAFSQYRNEITLPLHSLLTEEQVRYTSDTLIQCLDNIL